MNDNNPAFSFNHKQPSELNMDDLNEMIRAFNESGDDAARLFTTALVGNVDGPEGIMTMSIHRSKPERLLAEYNEMRNVLMTLSEPYQARDIGPVEDAFFVLIDDCIRLEVPIQTRPNDTFPLSREWDAFMNAGIAGPEKIKEIWNRRKITFDQLFERVKNMQIQPEDPNLRYHWYDRTE